ncbi:MAG: xylB [Ilumatobacteraceae bacterium]|nr:xylB [Ilumatobacteraceae bacterium]
MTARVNTLPTSSALMGIDLGAGGVKVSIITDDGTTLGEGSASIATSNPRFGWAEQDPADWWTAACLAIPAALGAAGLDAADIAAVGMSGGAHIGVLADDGGTPLRPAILWSDSRSAAEAEELRERADARIVELSLNRANPTWLLPQLLWIRRHDPQAAELTRRVFLSKDWLRFRLTGEWCTDYSDAVGALLADSTTGGWSAELCDLVGWDIATLPPIVRPTDVVGAVTAEAAAQCGLRAGTPVVCGSNDTTVELFGAGATEPGQGAVKLATAGVTYQVADGPLVRPPVSCYPHIIDGLYYTATGINSCASAHRWLRDRFFADLDHDGGGFDAMDAMAAGVTPGSEGLLFHPYLAGERAPHWDPQLRGDFIGVTFQHERAHFARALYEGIAFAIRDAMTVAEGLGMRYDTIRLVGGGARSATWRQIIADVLGRQVLLPANGDASFGAAVLAGVGIGVFADVHDAAAHCCRIVSSHEPDEDAHDRYSDFFDVYTDARVALTAIDHRLHELTVDP